MLETVTKQYREENRDKCIEKGKQHYEKCNERLQKMARDQYRRLSEKKKIRKQKIKQVIEHMKELLKGLRS